MTVSSNDSQQTNPFASLYPYEFVILTTFRKSGEKVPTTIWFAPDDAGHLYLTTNSAAGKLKRIRNNARVELVPSDARGAILDHQQVVTGYAREVPADTHAYAEGILKQKYGEQYDAFMARMEGNNSHSRTYIEIVAQAEKE